VTTALIIAAFALICVAGGVIILIRSVDKSNDDYL
jgi:hypothetical protein